MVTEARMVAERVGNLRERLAEMSATISLLGMLPGTLRKPSMSSEKQISRVGILSWVTARKAWRTMVVRATSPKVPIGPGRGAMTGLEDDGAGRLRDPLQPAQDLARLLEGPRLVTWAWADGSELISILGRPAFLVPRAPSSGQRDARFLLGF